MHPQIKKILQYLIVWSTIWCAATAQETMTRAKTTTYKPISVNKDEMLHMACKGESSKAEQSGNDFRTRCNNFTALPVVKTGDGDDYDIILDDERQTTTTKKSGDSKSPIMVSVIGRCKCTSKRKTTSKRTKYHPCLVKFGRDTMSSGNGTAELATWCLYGNTNTWVAECPPTKQKMYRTLEYGFFAESQNTLLPFFTSIVGAAKGAAIRRSGTVLCKLPDDPL